MSEWGKGKKEVEKAKKWRMVNRQNTLKGKD
jgi:hypothetical protein